MSAAKANILRERIAVPEIIAVQIYTHSRLCPVLAGGESQCGDSTTIARSFVMRRTPSDSGPTDMLVQFNALVVVRTFA